MTSMIEALPSDLNYKGAVSDTEPLLDSMAKLMTVLQSTMKHVAQFHQDPNQDAAPILRDRAALLSSNVQDILDLALSASSTMNRQSNIDTPIGRLPDEIIADILLSFITSFNDQYIAEPSQWRHVMHVCSRWSSIVRSDARVWGQSASIRTGTFRLHLFCSQRPSLAIFRTSFRTHYSSVSSRR
ncbi:hypothetical protein SISNIDRAFT_164337 [Sistotremastrum niveocremeum HHB9708]|uniref:F-box domain-containing protein n=1 Tax=Sistotremastrum niveocremeum HHB9708 TaxID=1314777 RepID=A0A164SFL8_9AGAM|nr:hypothetical protein SISNIDRAFT_164337 [Sistotremastrum niveocremeum HHB9708]